jgi:hypothetical protein
VDSFDDCGGVFLGYAEFNKPKPATALLEGLATVGGVVNLTSFPLYQKWVFSGGFF